MRRSGYAGCAVCGRRMQCAVPPPLPVPAITRLRFRRSMVAVMSSAVVSGFSVQMRSTFLPWISVVKICAKPLAVISRAMSRLIWSAMAGDAPFSGT